MKTDRFHQRQKQNLHDLSRRGGFQCRTRYDLQVWRDIAAVHTKTALSPSVTCSGLWRLLWTLKFSPLTNLVPLNHNARGEKHPPYLTERTPSWGVHTAHRPVSQAWEPPSSQEHNKRSSIEQFPSTWRTPARSPDHASAYFFRKLTMQLTSRNRHHRRESSAGNHKLKQIKHFIFILYQLYPLFHHKAPLIHCFNSTSSCALNIYPQHLIFSRDYFCLCIFPGKRTLILLNPHHINMFSFMTNNYTLILFG